MKKNKLLEFVNKFGKANLFVTAIFLVVIVSMSVCYAEFAELISTIGRVTIEVPNEEVTLMFEFVNYDVISNDNIDNMSIDSKDITDGLNIIVKNKIDIGINHKYQIRYTLYNGTLESYTYLGSEGTLNNDKFMYPEIYGISRGDIILPGEKREIDVIITGSEIPSNLEYELVFTFKKGVEEVIKPNIIGGVVDNKVLLNEENIGYVNMDITNLYDCSKEVFISVLDPDIIIMSEDNYLINKDTTEKVNFSIKLNRDYHDSITVPIMITTKDGKSNNVGEIILYKE